MNSKIEKLTNIISSLKKGSKIHIKKENRGKFADYCGGKVTSECIARGKSSPNPAIRKRATFAANARKWKHAEGGILQYQYGGVNNGTNKENPNLLIYKSFTPQQSDFDFSSFPIEPVKTYTFASSPIQTNTSTEEAAVATTPKIDTAYYPSSKTDVSEINVEEPISVAKSKYNKGEQSRFVKDMYSLYSKELSKRGLPKEYAK